MSSAASSPAVGAYSGGGPPCVHGVCSFPGNAGGQEVIGAGGVAAVSPGRGTEPPRDKRPAHPVEFQCDQVTPPARVTFDDRGVLAGTGGQVSFGRAR